MDPSSVGAVICRSDDLLECGTGVCFEISDDTQRLPAFAVRFGGKVRAFINRCGHMDLPLDIKPAAFFDAGGRYIICASHAALYDPETGKCVAGPCGGRGLAGVKIREQGGRVILVDTRYRMSGGAT